MRATDIIKRDHTAVKDLFQQFKSAEEEDRDELCEKIIDALETHETMEDTYFYPALKESGKDKGMVEGMEREQKKLAEELGGIKDMDEGRNDGLEKFMNKVLAHAQKEEREILPMAERILGAAKLEELGEAMKPESAAANA